MIDPRLRTEEAPRATDRTLREFAALWILVLGGVAAWRHWSGAGGATTWAVVAAAVGVPGLLFPALVRPLFVTLTTVTMPIGLVMSWLILAAVWWLVLTPIGLVFRLFGRDELRLRKPEGAASHWHPRQQPKDLRSYFRQS